MSPERVIPAGLVNPEQIESFPYMAPRFSKMPLGEPDPSDAPLGAGLTTPEEDAQRLASVDQVIFDKLQQAERDALDTARRGYEEGFASGENEGRAFGESQYRAHIQQLDSQLRDLSRALALLERASRDEVLALALAMAEYLAGRAIQDGAATLGPLLDTVLAARPFPASAEAADDGAAPVTVYLHPRDLEQLTAQAQDHPGLALREDGELTRGSLRLEAADGVLDASLEQRRTRLVELIQRFREQEAP
jgi:flagellar biosynthesis/type III secretory pathway protein FliH